jgi:hypothetical protein
VNTYEYAVIYRRPYWNGDRASSTHHCYTERQAEQTAARYEDEGCTAQAVRRLVGEWEEL